MAVGRIVEGQSMGPGWGPTTRLTADEVTKRMSVQAMLIGVVGLAYSAHEKVTDIQMKLKPTGDDHRISPPPVPIGGVGVNDSPSILASLDTLRLSLEILNGRLNEVVVLADLVGQLE